MVELTNLKNKIAQEKYFEDLQEHDAFRILKIIYEITEEHLYNYTPEYRELVREYLQTGIINNRELLK